MRVLVAPASFKECLSAAEAARALAEGVRRAGAEAVLLPLADGGRGTADCVVLALGGRTVAVRVTGPLGESVAAALGPWVPETVFAEIRRTVRGYELSMPVLATGGAAQTVPVNGRIVVDSGAELRPDLVQSDHNGLFTSGTLGRYSKVLNSVVENRLSR